LFVQIYTSFQQRAYDRFIELEVLNSQEILSPKELAKKVAFESKATIDKSDKKIYMRFIGGFIGLSLVLIFYGFRKWHIKIQPQQDLMAQQQIEKLALEIKLLKKQSNKIYKNKV
tara:strand:- start:1004 stop:1348 length:345 start_codon:yes stop_codon:yes gene_type:complete